MEKSFSEYGKSDVKKKVEESFSLVKENYEPNKKFYDGDHFQDGSGWSGALPGTATEAAKTLLKIKALFSSENVIKEVVDRINSAITSKDPEWNVHLKRPLKEEEAPKENEQKVIDDSEQALAEWWYTYNIQEKLSELLREITLGTKATLRIYIPSTYNKDGKISSGDFPEQLKKIKVEVVTPDKATVFEDVVSNKRAGLLAYKNDETDVVEISFLNDEGETIIKDIISGKESSALNLQGNLTMYQAVSSLLITQQVRDGNKGVNKAKTMMNSNLDSGFLERIFLNAEPPGTWEKQDDGTEKFIPANLNVGPNTTNFINGSQTIDEEGKVTATNASVVIREPSKNTTFVEADEQFYKSILKEVHQMHALLSGDAGASGESRIQALVDFINSCHGYKAVIDRAGAWLLKTVMYLAWHLSGDSALSEQYSIDFRCRLDAGFLPAEMRKQIIEEYKEGMLSRETAMSMLGVDDIDSEISRIDTATQHVKEVFEVFEYTSFPMPKTLALELILSVINDKEFLSDLKEGAEKNKALIAEIEENAASQVQEQGLFDDLGV